MYRKHADRLIVRDVTAQLAKLRRSDGWANWQAAVFLSRVQNPGWYRHHEHCLMESVGAVLRAAGVDMPKDSPPIRFVGNESESESGQ
jgi:hypothetical protein